MKSILSRTGVALVIGLTVAGCSSEAVLDNTVETAAFVGRTAVKGTVAAGKLVYRGGEAAVEAARASTAARSSFEAGTLVCRNADGGYYEALITEAGEAACLPQG
ncbi:MAG: hypothetical protein AAGF78_06105 [Pseudomonadota bacterium]